MVNLRPGVKSGGGWGCREQVWHSFSSTLENPGRKYPACNVLVTSSCCVGVPRVSYNHGGGKAAVIRDEAAIYRTFFENAV